MVLGLLVGGCADLGDRSTGAADCGRQIKSDGVVFSSYGVTSHAGTEYAAAVEAVCEDVGEDARGLVFTDESRLVTTYRFAGYPPSRVLGVRYRGVKGYAVFVADSVDSRDRDQIYLELRQPEK